MSDGKKVKSPPKLRDTGNNMVTISDKRLSGGYVASSRTVPPSEAKLRKANFEKARQDRVEKQERNNRKRALLLGRKNQESVGCKPSLNVYLFSKAKLPQRGGAKGNWFCGIKNAIKFTEKKYQNQENEFRVFIEGAEVTGYIQGGVSWTIESTGGMNTARFVLNNNEDLFIITPQNVCAGPYSSAGWRVYGGMNPSGVNTTVYDNVFRNNFRVDEIAKWQIYKTKYSVVSPDDPVNAQVDAITGMWLYPLNPYSCIFNRHDAVRIFVRIPHLAAFKRPHYLESYSMWMPAFTGFIKEYNWNDSQVDAKRVVNITCYDYRGLMERMRIRTQGVPPKLAKKKPGSKKQSAIEAVKTDQLAAGQPNVLNTDYLKRAEAVGVRFGKRAKRKYKKYMKLLSNEKNDLNTYNYANSDAMFMKDTLDDLQATLFAKRYMLGGTGTGAAGKPCRGTVGGDRGLFQGVNARQGLHYNYECSIKAIHDIDKKLDEYAYQIVFHTSKMMNATALYYEIKGIPTSISPNTVISKAGKKLTKRIVLKQISATDPKYTAATGALKAAKESSLVGTLERALKLFIKLSNDPYEDTGIPVLVVAGILILQYEAFERSLETRPDEQVRVGGQALVGVGTSFISNKERAKTFREAFDTGEKIIKRIDQAVEPIIKSNDLLIHNTNANGYISTYISLQEHDKARALQAANAAKQDLAKLTKEQTRLTNELKTHGNENENKKYRNPLLGAGGMRKKEEITKDITEVSWQISRKQRSLYAAKATIYKAGVTDGKYSGNTISQRLGGFYYQTFEKAFNSFTKSAVAVSILKQYDSDPISDAATIAYKSVVVQAIEDYKKSFRLAIAAANQWAKEFPVTAKAEAEVINKIFDAIAKDRDETNKLLANLKLNTRGINLVRSLISVIRTTTAAGKAAQSRVKTVADAITKFGHFEKKQAGIFADLVTDMENQPHPLMGKSFEMAVEYLCCEQSRIVRGVITGISAYNEGTSKEDQIKYNQNPAFSASGSTKLDQFNRVVLFGVIGRPLTHQEVTSVGKGTTSDLSQDFCPFNVYMHMLRPAAGTSPSTIVQQNTGQTGMNATSVNYETRKKLLDDICAILDYQFYVSGWGDLVFEMPNYNAFPGDFGDTFKQAYLLQKDWKSATISEEAQEIPTAWVITGLDMEAKFDKATGKLVSKNAFKKIVIMSPILARRLGVRVQNVNLRIPGIGGPIGSASGSPFKSSPAQALDQLQVYGYFYIQRQLGKAHTMSVSLPFRPYIIPNRPMWLVHRQRIGLVSNVTHTMNSPNGDCVTDISMGYTRWLNRDGTFRFIAGGQRQPIDYTAFYTGIQTYTPTEGVRLNGNSTKGKGIGRAGTGVNCAALFERMKQAEGFTSDISATFGQQFQSKRTPGATTASPPKGHAIDPGPAGLRQTGSKTAGGAATPGGPGVAATGPDDTGAFAGTTLGKYFNSPWSYLGTKGKGAKGFEAMGYLRKAGSGHYGYKLSGKGRNKHDYYHGGWDVGAAEGSHCLTPVDIYEASAWMRVGPLEGATNYAYIQVHRLDKGQEKLFGVYRGGSLVSVKEGGKTKYVKIYVDQYILYLAMRNRHGKALKLRRGGGGGGLMLETRGYYSNSKVNSGTGRMPVEFLYVHCADLAKTNGGTFGLTLTKSSAPNIPIAKAGDKVAYVGKTGSNQPHLHLNMYIGYNQAKNSADTSQVQLALAANKHYIDSTLIARAGGWTYDGRDPRRKYTMNSLASKYWQDKLPRLVSGLKKKNVTIADVVAYYQKRATYREFIPGDWDKADSKGVKWVRVNAALYFTPEQVVNRHRRQTRLQRFGTLNAQASIVGTSGVARYQLAKDFCPKFAQQYIDRQKAKMRACSLYWQGQNLARGFKGKKYWSSSYVKARTISCQRFAQNAINLAKKYPKDIKWVKQRITKEINAISRQQENRSYLDRASRGNSLGLAYINVANIRR